MVYNYNESIADLKFVDLVVQTKPQRDIATTTKLYLFTNYKVLLKILCESYRDILDLVFPVQRPVTAITTTPRCRPTL